MQEYILKGVVHACLGQATNDAEHLRSAQQYFQLVGASASECDTIPGRQCMASCFFLLQQFDDVLIFLNSIQEYFKEDDDFNWNLGIALAQTAAWKEVLFPSLARDLSDPPTVIGEVPRNINLNP